MDARKIAIGIVTLLLIVVTLLIGNLALTGEAVNTEWFYSYSTAVCNGNQCLDMEILCEGDDVVGMRPLTPIRDLSSLEDRVEPKPRRSSDLYCDKN
jgi:hypothetical protein